MELLFFFKMITPFMLFYLLLITDLFPFINKLLNWIKIIVNLNLPVLWRILSLLVCVFKKNKMQIPSHPWKKIIRKYIPLWLNVLISEIFSIFYKLEFRFSKSCIKLKWLQMTKFWLKVLTRVSQRCSAEISTDDNYAITLHKPGQYGKVSRKKPLLHNASWTHHIQGKTLWWQYYAVGMVVRVNRKMYSMYSKLL